MRQNKSDSQSQKNSEHDSKDQIRVGLAERIAELESDLAIKEHENNALIEENLELMDKLNEILISKAWKFVSFLRMVKLRMAPPHSWAAKIGRRVFGFLSKAYQFLAERIQQRKIRHYEGILNTILEDNWDCKDIIIFAPSVNWNISLFQRPQHLALQFSKKQILTFYLEPENSQSKAGFRKLQDRLYVCKVPVATFRMIKKPAVIFLSYNKRYVKEFTEPRIIYEYIDELTVFPGSFAQLKQDHQEFLQSALIVSTTAKRLYEQVVPVRPDALLVLNGVDYDHFHRITTEPVPIPTDLIPLRKAGGSIIGYYGALAKWFDYDLLKELALLRPDLNFVLIGPEYDKSLAGSGIASIANIHWLGIKDYKILPHYLSCFDVAMIPFKVNSITHSTSPLKLYEYMAGHKPVVVTPMSESMRIEGVLVAGSASEFSTRINEALELRQNPAFVALMDRVAQENTWSHRCDQIIAQLAKDPIGSSDALPESLP